MKVPVTLIARAAAAMSVVALSGCLVVPYPHTTTRSHSISGRVVDAQTGVPIVGASVQPFAAGYDEGVPLKTTTPVALSDDSGRFDLRRSTNMLWTKVIFAPCYGGIHEGGEYHAKYVVWKDGYVPVEFNVSELQPQKKGPSQPDFLTGDIPLAAGDSRVPQRMMPPQGNAKGGA